MVVEWGKWYIGWGDPKIREDMKPLFTSFLGNLPYEFEEIIWYIMFNAIKYKLSKIELPTVTGQEIPEKHGDGILHRTLKAQVRKYLESKGKSCMFEVDWFDVVTDDLEIKVEVGCTSPSKIISGLRDPKTREVWSIPYSKESLCCVFMKDKNFKKVKKMKMDYIAQEFEHKWKPIVRS